MTARRLSVSQVVGRVTQTRRRLEEQRRDHPFVDTAFNARDVLDETGGGLLAGAIAFRIFLFLVPAVFLFVIGFGLGADAAGSSPREAARSFGIAGIVATSIEGGSQASTFARWATFLIAAYATFSGARGLLKAVWVAHALVWKVRPGRLTRLPQRSVQLIGVFVAALALARVVDLLHSWSLIGWVVALALYTAIPATVWLLCSSRLFPRRPGVTWLHVLPGAVLFGIGAQALHVLTLVWLTRSVESKQEAYGAIGAALTILLWAYLLGLVMIAGAALNAAVWRRSGGAVPGEE